MASDVFLNQMPFFINLIDMYYKIRVIGQNVLMANPIL